MICGSCGTENRAGRKFCSRCGTALAITCPTCGAANEPDDRFCGECGSGLDASVMEREEPPTPVSERRLVSILFADLVGFTTLSEARDPEEVRELLMRYFDTARRLIARYGGTVEKFIGDAVMAVWGAPVAQEDDAERAARAALDLVATVATLGEEVGAPELALRAGVATGEAAVTLGAEGQGMVAGDLVNTASRVQTAADPGMVLVTDATRRASESSIAYESAGEHDLKGKTQPVVLSRAIRVVALRGGELRSVGLESPFVGRDREFRLLKDLFHATAEDRRAHLLSVSGIGGIGKSRLTWEFFKYIDGLATDAWWHRGRCIPYGDGVTYWALAEMVRMRARIAEEEEPAAALDKLHTVLDDMVPDADDRRFVEPRLAHLLGLEDLSVASKEDLFAGWRLFFERLADRWPVIMIFEDLQWADESLLDFVEYLLEWSRNDPLFVVTLARPELFERRPAWGASRHGSTSLSLGPLPDAAMDRMLRGMVPGLPDELLTRILQRAEGVPLYAVETVRMLLDRGLLHRDGDRFELTGQVDELAVPETLHALIASRLDGLPPEERALLQDASVLGKTFTQAGIATLSGRSVDELAPLLASLVRKELLGLQADARSPERGQYGFLQSLIQKVAYETLSRRDRKARHLAAADHLERGWSADPDEIVEVLAAHLMEAYRLGPEDEDAGEIRDRARDTLARAGRRAASLAAQSLARGYFERAAELSGDPVERAGYLEQAGIATLASAPSSGALELFERARGLFEEVGRSHEAARVSARIGEVLWVEDRGEEAAERMSGALAILAEDPPDHDLALLHAMLGKVLFFLGQHERSLREVDAALGIAERIWLPDVISDALNTKGLIADANERHEEALALLKRALELALDHDVGLGALRAYNNLSYVMFGRDEYEAARQYQEAGLALAERLGVRGNLMFLRGHLAASLWLRGEWDALAALDEDLRAASEAQQFYGGNESLAAWIIELAVARGLTDRARRMLQELIGDPASGDVQTRAFRTRMHSLVDEAMGEHERALDGCRRILQEVPSLSLRHDIVKLAVVLGLDAALALDRIDDAEAILAVVDPADHRAGPRLRAQAERFGARLAVRRGEDPEPGFRSAIGLLQEIGIPFDVART
ncbi:MAG TPA: adenylate/guanylate cyclase domain-containing protein, partial [Actinomycetota bacterium]|nr:adenylate/guanylate cyclase domain-containing protein [Actinomycetota bacterium]